MNKDYEKLRQMWNNLTHYPVAEGTWEKSHADEMATLRSKCSKTWARWGNETPLPDVLENELTRCGDAIYHLRAEIVRARQVAPPSSVVGPTNYRGRPEKARRIQENARAVYNSALKRLDRVLEHFNPLGAVSSDNPEAVQKLEEKASTLEREISEAKRINTFYKKTGKLPEDISLIMKEKAESYIRFCGRPFPTFYFRNTNAKRKTAERRGESISIEAVKPTIEYMVGEIKIVDSAEQNRIMIIYPSKPDVDTISKLKHSGWKWSPRNGAWQRLRNNNARYALTALGLFKKGE